MEGKPSPRPPADSYDPSKRPRIQLPAPNPVSGFALPVGLDPTTSPAEHRLPVYYPQHDVGSVSPNEPAALVSDFYRGSSDPGGMAPPGAMNPMMMHNPKRAYRQRRKDPSCDACRERKVKVIKLYWNMRVVYTDFGSVTPPRPPAAQNAQVATSDANSRKTLIGACLLSSKATCRYMTMSTDIGEDRFKISNVNCMRQGSS